MVELFADTYALFAALDGSPRYRKPFIENQIVTTALNVTELAYGLMRRGVWDVAPHVLPPFRDMIVEPDRDVIEDAARFKHDRVAAGSPVSYIDAWGYATARSLGIPFLTGDDDFKGVPGVKFVKA